MNTLQQNFCENEMFSNPLPAPLSPLLQFKSAFVGSATENYQSHPMCMFQFLEKFSFQPWYYRRKVTKFSVPFYCNCKRDIRCFLSQIMSLYPQILSRGFAIYILLLQSVELTVYACFLLWVAPEKIYVVKTTSLKLRMIRYINKESKH